MPIIKQSKLNKMRADSGSPGKTVGNLAVGLSEIEQALQKVRTFFPPTPLTHSPVLSEMLGRTIYFKWENKLRTGSFKERGAINFLSSLTPEQKTKGICAASAGNHALATSYYANRLKIPCTIVMPVVAPLVKIQSTRDCGARVILRGNFISEAYEAALELARDEHLTFVPGFDDDKVIAGQGTCGLEIIDQCPDFDSVVVPVGGGGLAAGIAIAMKLKRPDVYVLGVQSEWAANLYASPGPSGNSKPPTLKPTTIADGIALKIGTVTAPYLDRYLDAVCKASEMNIADAIIRILEIERTVIEGAGATALAGIIAGHLPAKYTKPVVLACGSNIDMNVISRLIEREMGERGRLFKVRVSVPDRPGSLHAATGILAKEGANVLEVFHDRSFSHLPGNVDITFLMEVKNFQHRELILASLKDAGVSAVVI